MSGTAFSSNDEAAIRRSVEISQTASKDIDWSSVESAELKEVFEINRCAEWIVARSLTRVGLQFPDSLLVAAPRVVNLLQAEVKQEVFILGDTTFGSCCVDEVAAEHLNADSIIHFGHTCLTPAQRLPVLYVFTRRSLDVAGLKDSISDKFASSDNLILVYDVEFDHSLRNFTLDGWGGRIIVAKPSSEDDSESDHLVKLGRTFEVKEWKEMEDFHVIYAGSGDERMLNFLLNFPSNPFWLYECGSLTPAGQSAAKLLMKRYYLVEKAKDAERIGILVGTLGTRDFNNILDRLRTLIRESGKKCYTFLVGKPNPAKLANFPEMDLFVLVACPETSFPDTRDYFQSVITPYELEVALNPKREWATGFFTDFRDLLPGGRGFVALPTTKKDKLDGQSDGESSLTDDQTDDEQIADVSLLTGKIRVKRGNRNVAPGSGELMVVNDKTVSLLHEGGGGEFLANRSWSGLEQKLGQTDVGVLVQGRSGIASGYSEEPVTTEGTDPKS